MIDINGASVEPEVESSENKKEPSTKERLKLTKIFKKLTCKTCSGPAYFLPTHNKVACLKCLNIKQVDTTIMDPKEYLSTAALDSVYNDNKRSQLSIKYQSPDSYALKDAPGRNEACICGSGKKFKKCCLNSMTDSRNNEVRKLYENNRANAVVTTANTFRLINMVREYFDSNPDKTELEADTLGYKPFKDLTGELEDVSVFDIEIAGE